MLKRDGVRTGMMSSVTRLLSSFWSANLSDSSVRSSILRERSEVKNIVVIHTQWCHIFRYTQHNTQNIGRCGSVRHFIRWPQRCLKATESPRGTDYTEACQLLIFSTGLIYVTLVGTEAATFGSPVQRANHCASETQFFIVG